jgi:cytoskeletal protein RodZ
VAAEVGNGTPPLVGQDLVRPQPPPVDPSESVPPPSPSSAREPAAQPTASQPVSPPPAPQPTSSEPISPPPAAQPAAPQPVSPPPAAAQPAAAVAVAAPAASAPAPLTPLPPPPGWYGDIYGNPPRWWDGTVWTEHVLVPLPAGEPAVAEPELTFLDNALISISLAPDWAKFLAAAAVTAVLALIGLGLLKEDSSSDAPDGFVPQTPELESPGLPEVPTVPEETGEPAGG